MKWSIDTVLQKHILFLDKISQIKKLGRASWVRKKLRQRNRDGSGPSEEVGTKWHQAHEELCTTGRLGHRQLLKAVGKQRKEKARSIYILHFRKTHIHSFVHKYTFLCSQTCTYTYISLHVHECMFYFLCYFGKKVTGVQRVQRVFVCLLSAVTCPKNKL